MRHEFPRKVRQDALRRSDGRCEATGALYGLPEGVRCTEPLAKGVEYDHWPLPAMDQGSDVLSNCVACCPSCHRWKTSHYDVPMQAKGRRIRQKHGRAPVKRKPRPKMQSRNQWPQGRTIPSRPFPKRTG